MVFETFNAGDAQRVAHVDRVARRANRQQNVARLPVAPHLLSEHRVGRAIVSHGGRERVVAGQGNGGQRALQLRGERGAFVAEMLGKTRAIRARKRTFQQETFHQFGDQMFAIGGAAAVAAHQQFAAALVTILKNCGGTFDVALTRGQIGIIAHQGGENGIHIECAQFIKRAQFPFAQWSQRS